MGRLLWKTQDFLVPGDSIIFQSFFFFIPSLDLSCGRWICLGLASRSGLRHFFGGFFGVFFSGILGVFFVVGLNGFVGVFFNVGTVRGFGVVRAYARGVSGIGTGIINPQSTGPSRLGNGLIWFGAGLARRRLWSRAGHARRWLIYWSRQLS